VPPTPSTTLVSAQEAKEKLREIVERFFYRRLNVRHGAYARVAPAEDIRLKECACQSLYPDDGAH
jgi:hypothetical protein